MNSNINIIDININDINKEKINTNSDNFDSNLNKKNENNIINESNVNTKKINIFMPVNETRPLPVKKKPNKNKIMDFLSNALVNNDNTPSYVNLFKNIKDKSKEKLENKSNGSANAVIIFK
jgi:hypothetical protein